MSRQDRTSKAKGAPIPGKSQAEPAVAAATPALLQRAQMTPGTLTPNDVKHLQRSIGNRATIQILSKNNLLQAKPKLGRAGDQHQQEADQVTQQAVRHLNGPKPVQRKDDDTEKVQDESPFLRDETRQQRKTPPSKSTFQRSALNHFESVTSPRLQREEKEKKTWRMGDSKQSKGKSKVDWSIGRGKKNQPKDNVEDTSSGPPLVLGGEKEEIGEIELVDGSLLEEEHTTEESPPTVEKVYDSKSEFQKFQHKYDATFSDLDAISVDVTARLNDFAHMSDGYEIENYTDDVLGNQNVGKILQNINQMILNTENKQKRQTANLIADLLLFASLHPVQLNTYSQGKKKAPKYKRLSANVINVPRLLEILLDVNQQLIDKQGVTEGETLAGIDFNDKDSIAQRMLKLSLTNIQQEARKELANDPLFKETLNNPEILKTMLASGSAIEQQFLNTCAAIAITQELQENVSHLAGLLLVGRGVINYIQEQMASKEKKVEKTLNQKERWFGRKTIKDTAQRRVEQATNDFDEIRRQAIEIMKKQPVNVAALQVLVRRWSRTMQKLSVLANLAEGKKNVPALSKKAIDEKWKTSAGLSVAGFLWLDRPFRRHTGIDQGSYRQALMSKAKLTRSGVTQPGQNLNAKLGDDVEERKKKLDKMWDTLFASGGTDFSVPGHSLYIQAVKRGGAKLFMVGDPLIDKHAFYTTAEMEKYVAKVPKQEMMVHDDSLTGGVRAQLIGDKVPFYRNRNDIGKTNPPPSIEGEESKAEAKVVHYLPVDTTLDTVNINNGTTYKKDEILYIRIIIKPQGVEGLADDKETNGWVSADKVIY